jgi:hypothetical protein
MGERARYLPGGHVEAVPEVDQANIEDEHCDRRFVVVPRGLVPLKEDALKKTSPVNAAAGRCKPDDQLLSFVRNLQPDAARP